MWSIYLNKIEGYEKFHNLHKGEAGLVVANGPSLADVPIEFLKSYVTLGCNRITAMCPEFVPTYYSCVGLNQLNDADKRETILPMLEHPDCKAAFINRLVAHLFPYDNIYSVLGGAFYGLENTKVFSYEPLHITGIGGSMTFILLQIAFYMGLDPVLVVGLDHNYPKGSKKHFYDDSEFPGFEVAPGPVYGNDGDLWQAVASSMFAIAQEVYLKHGRTIINLTRDSHCEVFRKEALSAWLNKD